MEVESSCRTIGIKLDSLNKIEEKKIEKLFKEINSKRIKKYDGENSAMIYYSVIKHNRIVDSLIIELKSTEENDLLKKEVTERFEINKTDLKNKLNTITEFNTKMEIDSLLAPSKDTAVLPNFTIIPRFQDGKLNASKSGELLLLKLIDKTKDEKRLK